MKLPGRMLIPWRKKTPPARIRITAKTLKEIFIGIYFIGVKCCDDYTLEGTHAHEPVDTHQYLHWGKCVAGMSEGWVAAARAIEEVVTSW